MAQKTKPKSTQTSTSLIHPTIPFTEADLARLEDVNRDILALRHLTNDDDSSDLHRFILHIDHGIADLFDDLKLRFSKGDGGAK